MEATELEDMALKWWKECDEKRKPWKEQLEEKDHNPNLKGTTRLTGDQGENDLTRPKEEEGFNSWLITLRATERNRR